MKAFVVISDQHTGHKQGLLNPDSEDDGKPIHLSAVQESLWEITQSVRDSLPKKAEKWLIHMGETTQGNQHKDDLLTAEMYLQFKWSAEVLHPFLDTGFKGVRFLQATSWHEYGDGSSSKLMVELLKEKYRKTDFLRVAQSRIAVGDLLFEWTHHGSSTSKRKYLEGNAAFLDAKDRIINHIIEGKRCPDITFSAHTHKPSKSSASILSNGEYVSNTQIITPPMCGPGCYSRKVANPSMYYVGMHVVLTDGIGFDVIPYYKRLYDYTMEAI